MENVIIPKNKTLKIKKFVLERLFEQIINRFKKIHQINYAITDSQLYGFGNYNSDKPNLKRDLETILHGYVNGKYLYNKYREMRLGKPEITISREYRYLYFNYLGYKNVFEFLEAGDFTEDQKGLQLELIDHKKYADDHFYAAYYLGEDDMLNKGHIVVYNDWKTVEVKFVYENKRGIISIYTFFGTVKLSEDFAFFDTKYFRDNSKKEGAKYIFFIGKSSPYERLYLKGTYCGFDKYDNTIAGIMILKKMNSKAELENEVEEKSFDPIICQELKNGRFIVPSQIHKNLLQFSQKSPFAQIYFGAAGKYSVQFNVANSCHTFQIEIQKYHSKIISLDKNIVINDDKMEVLSKGQILFLDFMITGMFFIQKVSIYVPLLQKLILNLKLSGEFIGVNINNEILKGTATLKRI